MAVLLDNFLSASTAMEREERREEQGHAKLQTARDSGLYLLPLEPLLLKLTRDYVDSADLDDRLEILYQVPYAPDRPFCMHQPCLCTLHPWSGLWSR